MVPDGDSKDPVLVESRPRSAMHRVDAWRMIRRCARDAGLDAEICCHTFRATGITAYLDNSGTLENAQARAAHEKAAHDETLRSDQR
jgi:integrase